MPCALSQKLWITGERECATGSPMIPASPNPSACDIGERSGKPAPAITGQTLFIAPDPAACLLTAVFPDKSDQFVDREALLASIHGDAVDLARDDGAACQAFGRLPDQDLGAIGL